MRLDLYTLVVTATDQNMRKYQVNYMQYTMIVVNIIGNRVMQCPDSSRLKTTPCLNLTVTERFNIADYFTVAADI